MAYQSSKALIGSAQIIRNIRSRVNMAVISTMCKAADKALEDIKNDIKFKGVTGNAYNSIAAGVYYKGKCIYITTMPEHSDQPPLRKTLRKGEVYFGRFWGSGYSPLNQDSKYVGTYGSGGQWGPTLGRYYLKRQHPSKSKTWEIVITIPVSYAGVNMGIVRTLQTMMDNLPSEVEACVVKVNDSPSTSGKYPTLDLSPQTHADPLSKEYNKMFHTFKKVDNG